MIKNNGNCTRIRTKINRFEAGCVPKMRQLTSLAQTSLVLRNGEVEQKHPSKERVLEKNKLRNERMNNDEELLMLVNNIRSNAAVIAIGVWGIAAIITIGLIIYITGVKI